MPDFSDHKSPQANQPTDMAVNLEAIEDHLERFIGEPEHVIDDLASEYVHLDVLVYTPNADRDYYLLVTSGASDLRMNVCEPVDQKEWSRVELVLALPRKMGDPLFDAMGKGQDPGELFWPIGELKYLGKFSHANDTWIGPGHTFGGDDSPAFSPDTRLNSLFFDWPELLPEDAWSFALQNGDTLNFYGVVFLYPEELKFKQEHSTDELRDLLEISDVCELLDPHRKSAVKSNPNLQLVGD